MRKSERETRLRGGAEFGRKPRQGAVSIDAGERRLTFADEIIPSIEFVLMLDANVCDSLDTRSKLEFVVILGRLDEPTSEFGDDEKKSLFFHGFVIEPRRSEHLRASHLEVNGVIRMVHEPHLVGLGIADSKHNLMKGRMIDQWLPRSSWSWINERIWASWRPCHHYFGGGSTIGSDVPPVPGGGNGP